MGKGLVITVAMLCLCACGEEEPEEVVRTSRVRPLLFKGDLTVKGTVELPPGVASGRSTAIQFVLLEGERRGIETHPGLFTDGSKTMAFEIIGLQDGEYRFRMWVDQNDDREEGPGDFEGWYGGTVQNPILDEESAPSVKLEGRNHEDISFGIGPMP